MHRSEEAETLSCAACGSAVDTRASAYVYGADGALCFDCAVKRGGAYNAGEDHWYRVPDVSDLPSDD